MTPFTVHTGIAASMPAPNVDTDVIMPKQFLKRIDRAGLAEGAFHDLRQDPGFVLNREPWSDASILICGENFGCGSSREYAVWGLMQWGIRVIVAPSIAGIFFGNCEKNGLLAITLPPDDVAALATLAADPATVEFEVDLPAQAIRHARGETSFDIPQARKTLLMEGKDHVARTLEHENDIAAYEAARLQPAPRLSSRIA
ncbi:3-isopropylmalate dehydratase small subunit [Jannaschia aquimarina]|uniref:3-isopropylmalate dehydratase small subunit n=1 Tax=Jannaschia aquimarina TaxID=935700 RepID=A0A0D1EH91_9RHOB|nr:3-isopropylmalate dehydratase small subunit [Jannaschia aquimarina]KIT16241.1 3-isopropylmalate dehydratase small subunit 1 [Jannaschia aquimarina]SNT15483.1 3-isopropylmalate/(R)-2-methylmalate dehydratase small subunit [Jannaschia aquimarina]